MSLLLFAVATFISIIGHICDISEISKQLKYNDFADKRCVCCIRNFMDVITNMSYIVIPLLFRIDDNVIFWTSIAVAIGSSYYHWNPTLERLFWDRLPMSIMFGYVISIAFDSRIMLFLSIGSVIVWRLTYNLVPYAIVQYAPIIMFLLYDCGMREATLIYGLAKLCEVFDRQIYVMTRNLISGHSLKHIISACAIAFVKPEMCYYR